MFRLIAAALVVASVVAPVGGAGRAANSTTFIDPSGDNPGGRAADITTVTITSDDAGTIRFRVLTPNRPTLQSDDALVIYLNTDRDKSTGQTGSEFRIYVFGGSRSIGLAHWNGSAWDEGTPHASFSGSFASGLTAAVNASELGGTMAFDFFVVTLFAGSDPDYAPSDATDGGRWTYSLTPAGGGAKDTDNDGIDDASDVCPNQPAGSFDSNHNGCPGPFATVSVTVPHPVSTHSGLTTFGSAVFVLRPPGATLTLSAAGRSEKRIAGTSGRLTSRVLSGHTFRAGTTITVRAVARGRIGIVLRYRVTTVAPGLAMVSKRCLSPAGGAALACSRVDRGK